MKTRDEIIKDAIFDYLDDEKLKEELYSSAYYVFHLIDQLDKVEKDEFIYFSTKHNIIILLWWIIETLLFQYVYKYFAINNDEKSIKKFCKKIEYTETTQVIEINDKKGIWLVFCERKISYESFKDNINFDYLIKWAKDNHLLSDDILVKIDNFRQMRNWVHLNVLMNIREIFSNAELTNFFEDNKNILKSIKSEYIKLNKNIKNPQKSSI